MIQLNLQAAMTSVLLTPFFIATTQKIVRPFGHAVFLRQRWLC
jgi:hypothetical protein